MGQSEIDLLKNLNVGTPLFRDAFTNVSVAPEHREVQRFRQDP